MSHTYAHNPVHVVFSTKERRKLIPGEHPQNDIFDVPDEMTLGAYIREDIREKLIRRFCHSTPIARPRLK
jgi:hypothetical protein